MTHLRVAPLLCLIPLQHEENTKETPRKHQENTKRIPKHLPSPCLATGLSAAAGGLCTGTSLPSPAGVSNRTFGYCGREGLGARGNPSGRRPICPPLISPVMFEPNRDEGCLICRVIWGFFIGAQYSLTAPFFFSAFTAYIRALTATRVPFGSWTASLLMRR